MSSANVVSKSSAKYRCLSRILDVHDAPLLSHLVLSNHRVGLRIDFHVLRLKDGIRRMVNRL